MQRYEKATKYNKIGGKNMKTRLFITGIILTIMASSCTVSNVTYYDDVYTPSTDNQYVEPVTPPQNNDYNYSQNQPNNQDQQYQDQNYYDNNNSDSNFILLGNKILFSK